LQWKAANTEEAARLWYALLLYLEIFPFFEERDSFAAVSSLLQSFTFSHSVFKRVFSLFRSFGGYLCPIFSFVSIFAKYGFVAQVFEDLVSSVFSSMTFCGQGRYQRQQRGCSFGDGVVDCTAQCWRLC
jgi:hypothetical protein